jgi:hypothetical protein
MELIQNDNIKIDPNKRDERILNFVPVAQERIHLQAVVSSIMNILLL